MVPVYEGDKNIILSVTGIIVTKNDVNWMDCIFTYW
jgi:hypothetical protein